MYTLFEVGPHFTQFNDESRRLGEEILSAIPCLERDKVFSSGTNLAQECKENKHLLLLSDGTVAYTIEDRLVLHFEQGDLIGLEEHYSASEAVVSSDFGVKGDVYDASALDSQTLSQNVAALVAKFLGCRAQGLAYLLRYLVKDDVLMSPEIRHFEPGETILSQGGIDDDVYTLVEGRAEAFVNGQKVGDILRDEIFGMLAAITKSPRSATVVAAERCMVVVVPKDKFIGLVRSRPESILKVLEDMGRMIVDLNRRVVMSSTK